QNQDQDTENQVIEYDNSSVDAHSSNQGLTDTGNEDASSQDLEPEVEATTDTETDTSTEPADGEEVEAAEDTVATDSASQAAGVQAGAASGNGAAAAELLKVSTLGDSGEQENLSDAETEVETGEGSGVAATGSGGASFGNGLNASGGNGAAGGAGSGSSGGSVQVRGGANGIRGTVSALGTADQGWTGGLQMPAGYPASGGLQMPDTAASEDQAATQAGAVAYKVKKGDTLWSIAKKHYGDGKKWRKILEANLDKVRDPKKLKIGTELVIPKI
ncbi:MAG: LysM peptidoglycan-binding domain-containing protein, partial [Patescibacteria group bacterium]|nr:LysM peptidoglycan-binding domain-containing protein [Patescibacteria group bacterium]